MIYSDYITTIADLIDVAATITDPTSATPSSDSNFNNYIAYSIVYTENRIQRDLDLINTLITDESGALTANQRRFILPTDLGTFVVVEQVYLTISGVRQAPLLPISYEALNAFYPSDTALSPPPSIPLYWAPRDGTSITVGPAADSAYGCSIIGTVRLPPLSSTNTSNFLTTSFPDLYIAAAMVAWSGYQRDFGSQSDDPAQAQSWERQYETLKTPSLVEEARKKFMSLGWGAKLPSLTATPPQT